MSDTDHRPPVPRLKAQYDTEIRAALKEQLGLANIMQVPRLEKIVDQHGRRRRRRPSRRSSRAP